MDKVQKLSNSEISGGFYYPPFSTSFRVSGPWETAPVLTAYNIAVHHFLHKSLLIVFHQLYIGWTVYIPSKHWQPLIALHSITTENKTPKKICIWPCIQYKNGNIAGWTEQFCQCKSNTKFFTLLCITWCKFKQLILKITLLPYSPSNKCI
jgi:hypothetical protein